jgi:serine/threonine protein kinase
LYEVLTGKRAFDGDNTAAIITAIMTVDPPALGMLDSSVPRALERVVRRCLAKDPDDRWQTARDLLAELRWILDGPRTETLPAAVLPRRKKWKPWLAIAEAAVVLAAAWLTADRIGKPPGPP